MESFLIPAAAAVVVFILFLLLLPKRIMSEEQQRKRVMITQMSQETQRLNALQGSEISLLRQQSVLPPGSLLAKIPGAEAIAALMVKSAIMPKLGVFLTVLLLIALVLTYLLRGFGPLSLIAGLLASFLLGYKYLWMRIRKRNEQFINQFPDAVDMIVRSVRSGHPLNTALRMIAENTDNPIRDEFKQVVDEVSYGRPLTDALQRLATRIDEQDLHFFVVVLSVHQETGGSLAEVLSNLSGIIRKRKQLRLKIKALTSEGRATSYVLGGLPVVEFLALYFMTPEYMAPLFSTFAGNVILGVATALIIGAIWIVRIMVNIDI